MKSKFWKFAAWFVVVVIGAVVILWGIGWYDQWKGERDVQQFAEALKKAQQADYDRAMADTYGGKTPQETLQMYIDAVEKGDYQLASKYFVLESQQKELTSLQSTTKENIGIILGLLKQTLTSQGSSSGDGNGFVIRKPLLVDFTRYPNGIWKIIEI